MPSTSRPNILLCLFDSLSALSESAANAKSRTSNFNRLRKQSVVFASAYTPCPESSPARASLFTGLDPSVHGVWSNGVSLPRNEETFPQQLSHAGYTNALVGRRQLAGVANWTTEHAHPDEFSSIEWAHGPLHRSRQNAYLNWLQSTAPERYASIFPIQPDADNTVVPTEQFVAVSELPDELSFNHWIGLRTKEFISSSDQPFLAVAGFSVGASLGTEPSQDVDVEALNPRALQQADAALGLVLDHLVECSLQKDTVIILTAARGCVSANRDDQPMRERAITVPLFMSVPNVDSNVVNAPVSTMDIAPTILDIAGLPQKPRLQGTSLLAMLNGASPFRNWALSRLRSNILNERGEEGTPRSWQTAFRFDNMKLVVHHGNLQAGVPILYQLFDLQNDPEELIDLARLESHADELENMIDLLIDARCALEDRTEPRIAKF